MDLVEKKVLFVSLKKVFWNAHKLSFIVMILCISNEDFVLLQCLPLTKECFEPLQKFDQFHLSHKKQYLKPKENDHRNKKEDSFIAIL